MIRREGWKKIVSPCIVLHTHPPTYTPTYTQTATQIHIDRHTHTDADRHMQTDTYSHVHPHARTRTHTQTDIDIDIHTRTHTRTHIRTHARTHTYMSICLYISISISFSIYTLIRASLVPVEPPPRIAGASEAERGAHNPRKKTLSKTGINPRDSYTDGLYTKGTRAHTQKELIRGGA